MAKALFLSLPLHGHTNPTLPLVRELVAHGESIVYFSSPPFAAKIEHAGGHYRPYRNAFLEEIRDLPERVHQLAWLLMRTTAEVLDEELEILRAERPDYIICDSVAPWGQCVGQSLRIPVVTSISTFAFNRRVLAYAATRGIRPKSARIFLSKAGHVFKALLLRRKVRRRHGVAPRMMEIVSGRSDLNIVYTSRHFQPCAESFDERYQFVGPSISARLSTETFPWERVRDATAVYVSLGTIFNAEPDFFRACLEAFRHAPYHVIMSIGSNIPATELGAVPPNFTVRPHVPQLEVLQRARVFVTHGGMNSVSESLYYGVPVVVVPQVGEQAIVGKRVEELGAGTYLPKKDVTAATLLKAVDQLAANELARKKATEIGDSFRNAGGVARARDAILSSTRKENPDIG